MKTNCLIVAVALLQSFAWAREESGSDWKIMPSISVAKLFSVGNRNHFYDVQPLMYPPIGSFGSSSTNSFSATGVSFSARFLNKEFEPLAFTLSAGANWFRSRNDSRNVPTLGYVGPPIRIDDSLRMPFPDFRGYRVDFFGMEHKGFMSFPVGVGAQVVFPYEKIDKLMFFAGVEGNLHFLSERAVARRQVEAGFSALGGVAIKMFEFGLRYSRFAGMSNVGVQAGIRFSQFEL